MAYKIYKVNLIFLQFMNWLAAVADHPFYEFAIILALAAVLGAAGQLLKQPLIVTFILLGILLGPSMLNVVRSKEQIGLLAEIGIAVLLFIVGLKLDLRIIRSVGRIALITGMGQVIFTSLLGYVIGLWLGFSSLHSFYIALALTFSSTIIIVKLLSDNKEIDSLHGQITIGLLIVQDIVVILVMIVLSSVKHGGEDSLSLDIIKRLGAGVLMILFAFAAMKWIIPALNNFLARSQEMLTLFAVAWAVTLAAAGEMSGFSGEVGAFMAGVSLASSDFRELISSRLQSLRDFLLLFFFVNLGVHLDLSVIGSQVWAALLFSLFVLIGKPIVVMAIMGAMGYRKRTSFLTSNMLPQISEFSLIFAGLGLSVGHINAETVGLITLVGLITITLSTYLALYSHRIYNYVAPSLRIFERKMPVMEDAESETGDKPYDVVIIGLGRFGSKLADMLDEYPEIRYLGIDFDPGIIQNWKSKGRNIIYGDMEDPELLSQFQYRDAKMIVSTVADMELSIHLLKSLRRRRYSGQIFLSAMNDTEYKQLADSGVCEVLRPHQMAAANFYNTYLATGLKKAEN